jgi:phosphatidate phosphatase PAH1
MLFTSIGMTITPDCIVLNNDEISEMKITSFCNGPNQSLVFYVNGERQFSDISQYVFDHNDRILISFGDDESISKHLSYLESLEIFDIPKKTPQHSGNDITI